MDNKNQFEQCMDHLRSGTYPVPPEMTFTGKQMSVVPHAYLYCQIEQTDSDPYIQVTLCIATKKDGNDSVEVDFTLSSSLQSMSHVFTDEVPSGVLICMPLSIPSIIAHVLARKAGYVVNIEERRTSREVEFILNFGNGNYLTALIERGAVERYFGWKPLEDADQLFC